MLSNTVSNALEQFGDESVTETARFVGMIDKFFDALNVHNYHHGYHANKKFQEPYEKRDKEDFRLKVNIQICCAFVYFKIFIVA